jgi:CRISPR-associated protein Cmr5
MTERTLSNRQSLDQQRAAHAWQNVKQVDESGSDKLRKRYAALARKTPANIQSSGLGQTLAFLRAKAGRDRQGGEWMLYQHVSAWVMKQMKQPDHQADQLLEWVIQENTAKYRQATAEAMAYLGWLKRFAEAVLPEPAGEE